MIITKLVYQIVRSKSHVVKKTEEEEEEMVEEEVDFIRRS